MLQNILYKALLGIRPAPVAVFLKNLLRIRRKVIATANGQFWVDPVSKLGIQLFESGIYEPEMERAIRMFLSAGDAFVDVGANEGYFSILASKAVGEGGKVLAIEPQHRLLPVINTNIELNGCHNVVLLNCAVSDSETKMSLFLGLDTNTGSSSLAPTTTYRQETQDVKTLTLQSCLEKARVERAELIKVDIEGHEYEAIMGSPELFRSGKIQHIAIEFHPAQLERRGLQQDDIGSFLVSCGYQMRNDYTISVYSLTARP